MTRKRFLSCCLALSCVSVVGVFVNQVLAAPRPGELDITTVDEAGAPAPFVRVTVNQVNGRYRFRATTDQAGHVLMTIPEGTYQITASGATGPPVVASVVSRGYTGSPTFVVIEVAGLD